MAALRRAAIQLAVEITMDFLVTMYLAVIQNYHLMTNSQLKVRRYGWIVGSFVVVIQVWFNIVTLMSIVCFQRPEIEGTHWVMCGKARSSIYGKQGLLTIR